MTNGAEMRGEFTIVVAPPAADAGQPDAGEVDALLRRALQHASVKDAVSDVAAATGRPRREIYQRALALSEGDDGSDGVIQTCRRASPRPERVAAHLVGLSAESRAAAYLVAKGYRIVARRCRSPVGEIDIVARRRGVLVFVEVKARSTLDDAAESLLAAPAAADRGGGRRLARRASRGRRKRHPVRRGAGRAGPHPAPHSGGVRDGLEPRQAARRFCENASIWSRMRCATAPSSSATARTAATLARVLSVASPTRLTSSAVSSVRLAATSTLRAISCVAAPCSVTAAAIAPLIAPMSRMVRFDRRDRLDRTAGGVLHVGDLLGDVFGGLGGLAGQRLDLARHHGKAAAGLAGARGLDGGVERQQIGLLGDVGDEPDDVADALGRLAQLLHRRVGAFGLADRLLGDGVRLRHLAVDLHHRGGKLVGRRGDVAHVGGGFGRGGRWRPSVRRDGAIGGLGKTAWRIPAPDR